MDRSGGNSSQSWYSGLVCPYTNLFGDGDKRHCVSQLWGRPGLAVTPVIPPSLAILGESVPTMYVVDSSLTNKLVKKTSKPIRFQGTVVSWWG